MGVGEVLAGRVLGPTLLGIEEGIWLTGTVLSRFCGPRSTEDFPMKALAAAWVERKR